uniref:Uncharacterized protein n=1 Tax=Anopheles epiroticus TaxID=199890 RepID=A0A182PA20_9DIPT
MYVVANDALQQIHGYRARLLAFIEVRSNSSELVSVVPPRCNPHSSPYELMPNTMFASATRSSSVCTITFSPSTVMSGRLKWASAVRAAIEQQSMALPSWFSTVTSTRSFHTFSSDTRHSDSRSTQPESFSARSRMRFSCTHSSDWRPPSKCGAAIGPSSTFTKSIPSFGRVAFGSTTSQVIRARARVSPRMTCTRPHSLPKHILSLRNSSCVRPSIRW